MTEHRVIVRRDIDIYKQKHVTLISGGGSGHEPSHAGFVGEGMLSAAVAGDIFASPPAEAVYAAIKAVAGPPGVLLIVKNYTGDRLHFGLAAERARAEGIAVETVFVADDCAIPRSTSKAGRRGLAGTVFVHKVAGAVADMGETLHSVAAAARAVAADVATMSVSVSPCIVPGRGPSFELPQGWMGLGLGIHGEDGVARQPIEEADALAERLVSGIFAPPPDYGYFSLAPQSRVALLVNNLGGTSQLEVLIFLRSVLNALRKRDLVVARVYFGTHMSSLSMAGLSISLLRLDKEIDDMPREVFLDLPVRVLAWMAPPQTPDMAKLPDNEADAGRIGELEQPPAHAAAAAASAVQLAAVAERPDRMEPSTTEERRLHAALQSACRAVIDSEGIVTDLDRKAGDGDCGETLRRGAQAVLDAIAQKHVGFDRPSTMFADLARTVSRHMGGSSGALYSMGLAGASTEAKRGPDVPAMAVSAWGDALQAGLNAIMFHGGASEGDRTMLDVLLPVARVLCKAVASATVHDIADSTIAEAKEGILRTEKLEARAGRASYVASQSIAGVADAGAYAAAQWVIAAIETLRAPV